MNRRYWKVAAGILAAAALVTITGLLVMMASLYSVAIDLLEIASLHRDH